MYITELFIGVLCGVVLSLFFSFGPAFFGLIQSSVQHGFRRAMAFVVGVSLSDLLVVFLMLTVLQKVEMDAVIHNVWVASIAGAGIIAMGIYVFRKRAKAVQEGHGRGRLKFKGDETRMRYIALHGFLLNILNPFIWIYWVSVVALLSGELELGGVERYVFFAGLLASTFGCDMLKCRLASLLQAWITAPVLNITNKVMGGLLMCFGIYLIVSMVVYQNNPEAREKEQDATQKPVQVFHNIHNRISKDSAKRSDTIYFK